MRSLKSRLFVILLLVVDPVFGFVQSKTDSKVKLFISSNNESLTFDFNVSIPNVDPALIESYLLELGISLTSQVGIEVNFYSGDSGSTFTIEGSDDPDIFSSSTVAAVTKISYDESGEILGANIILNLNVGFSEDELSYNYFGNSISHEVGHSLGLDHSTSWSSTMTPHLSPGQHTWEHDDITGAIFVLGGEYPYRGTISGTITGGSDRKKILGTVVDLVELDSLKSIQSTITNRNGEFKFVNVDESKKYLVFYGPFNFTTSYQDDYLLSYSNFCQGRTDYGYTALSSCLSSYDQSPRAIAFDINQSELSLGEIGIKCDIDSSDVLYDYSINDVNENDLLDSVDFSTKAILLKGILADERSFKIPLSFRSMTNGNVIRISILSQLLRSPYVLHGVIRNLDNGEEVILGESSFVELNGVSFPSYEGLPNYNFIEYLHPEGSDANYELELVSYQVLNLLNDGFSEVLSESNFHFDPKSSIGSFILELNVGTLDESGKFISNNFDEVSISNDSFECSSAINSFEIPESPDFSGDNSNEIVTPKMGCSAFAADKGTKSVKHSYFFILEVLFYVLMYVAFSRLSRSQKKHK